MTALELATAANSNRGNDQAKALLNTLGGMNSLFARATCPKQAKKPLSLK